MLLALWALCLACPLAARAADAPGDAQPSPNTVRLQLKWKHQFQFAGYYAAVEKGFFAKEGLRVELIEGQPGLTPSERLFTGQADYAVDSTSILLQRQEGRKVVALAAVFQHSPNILLTRRDKGLGTPQSLAGKRIMMTPSTDPECRAMLANEGVTLKDYTTVPHTWTIEPLVDGTVDAMTAYLTDEPYLLEQRGFEPCVIYPNHYAVDFYGDCLTTSEDEIINHPGRVEAFLRAVDQGWRYAMAHPEEIADVILARYHSAMGREGLLYEAQAMRSLILPDLVEIGHMNPERWRHIAHTYERLGMLRPGFSLEGFLYPEFKKSLEERERGKVRTVLGVVGGAALLAGFGGAALLVFNKRLSRRVGERTRELKESRDFFLNLINTISDPIFVKDGHSRYVLVNEAKAAMSGHRSEDFPGRSDEAFFPGNQAMSMRRMDEAVLRSGRESVCEERLLDEGGAQRLVLTKKSRYTDSSGKVFLVGVQRDITEFSRMQDMVVQAEKMVSLGGLAAGMAHEVNNPLGIIMQSSQNLQRRLFESLGGNRKEAEELGISFEGLSEYLRRRGVFDAVCDIREAGERAGKIVKNMLEFSRKSETEQIACDLAAIVENVLGIISSDYDFKKSYDFRKIKIEKEYSPESFPVPCTRTKIAQVVLNILMNAVQAMAASDTMIEDPRIILRIHPDGDLMRVDIQDNGPGMDETVRKRIFEPFFTTKESGAGTGLGMFVSYSIVAENHGGRLLVKSAPGKGTTFSILLPRGSSPQ
ncbi:ABC transporter substrate-binding protein [Fundidesulfovibrio terrae]|uniref:ABC transporter substrate-binding protein n=1 Tax=Fundidesulfovibrio terrae TaxID=2922866 RepID=UPI001FAFFECA|nr:ABC transporter substrate-binding protein [Fundidesulfovibrio terrae]